MQLIAQKNKIKWMIVGAVTLVCVLIFLCRIPGLRGFRWLATDLFIGSGFGIVLSVSASMGVTVLQSIAPMDASVAAIINPIMAMFARGLIIRTVVMLVSAVALLVAYIMLKKVAAKKACCDLTEESVAQELSEEPVAEKESAAAEETVTAEADV